MTNLIRIGSRRVYTNDHFGFPRNSGSGQLETFPALSRMSVAGGKADEIGTKADFGA